MTTPEDAPANPTTACAVFRTTAGFCGIGWSERGISRFQLPLREEDAARRALARRTGGAPSAFPPPDAAKVIAAVRAYFEGAPTDFVAVAIDPGRQDAFAAQVYDHVRHLAWGETTTYGAVARALGVGPERARDVGAALGRNPLPLLVPCHRVLAAGGRPGGFSAPGGTASKLRMLALEGNDLAPAQAAFAF
jgi:methylated-DNA-[protein]-cysteine S-methyltransferase